MARGRGQRHGLRDPRLVAEVEVGLGGALVDPRVERLAADAGEHARRRRRWRTPRRRRRRRARRARRPGRAAGCPSRSGRGSRRPRRACRRRTASPRGRNRGSGRPRRRGRRRRHLEHIGRVAALISPQPSTRPTVPGDQAAVSVESSTRTGSVSTGRRERQHRRRRSGPSAHVAAVDRSRRDVVGGDVLDDRGAGQVDVADADREAGGLARLAEHVRRAARGGEELARADQRAAAEASTKPLPSVSTPRKPWAG